jgi:hypothetical protein
LEREKGFFKEKEGKGVYRRLRGDIRRYKGGEELVFVAMGR